MLITLAEFYIGGKLTEHYNDNGFELALNNRGIFTLMASISTESIRPVIEWIVYENHAKTKRKHELTLLISSEGGSVNDAFALIDIMHGSTIPIRTVGFGVVASAGLMIFLAGKVGSRTLTPNTSILSHQFSWFNEGKAHELYAAVKEFDLTQQRMIRHYEQTTGMSADSIREKLLPPQDVWLSAHEALDLRICDKVTGQFF